MTWPKMTRPFIVPIETGRTHGSRHPNAAKIGREIIADIRAEAEQAPADAQQRLALPAPNGRTPTVPQARNGRGTVKAGPA